jgi:CheY-like chemotaxis protein
MTHGSSEGRIIDSLQVLVIAEEVIANRIRLRFDGKGMDIKAQSPPTEDKDLSWLIRLLFPDVPGEDSQRLGEECSLFGWNRFDVVILTDIWWADTGESRARYAAGRVFALWDNNRGNFATRKIVLVSDADDFESMVRTALNEPPGASKDSQGSTTILPEDVDRTLDPKRSITLVNAGHDNFLTHLEACIYSATRIAPAPSTRESMRASRSRLAAVADSLTRPVIRKASVALQRSIRHTHILVIDDEQSALETIYNAVTGGELNVTKQMSSELTVKLLNVKTKGTTCVGSFDDLDKLSTRETKSALEKLAHKDDRKDMRDVVVVTDILFEIGDSTRTGIDIIRSLRKALRNRIGIIVFTNFTTPFVAMAAYRQGADYVIQKDGSGGRHESLRLNGFDRLVEALAILSFQRSYLRRVRRRCLDCVENVANNDELAHEMLLLIRLFERTVPQQTVSLHMQQEWEDTYWLLKMVQTGNDVKTERVKAMLNEFRKKY